jgi:HSP20 family protein
VRGSAEEAVRLLVDFHLAHLRRAARRFTHDTDGEAMHDLRVAARKLRVVLRAYGVVFSHRAERRGRRHLAAIMRATSTARDLEVALAHLRNEREEQAALGWLRARWESRCRRARKRARRRIKRLVPEVVRAMRRSLRACPARGPRPVPFSELARRAVLDEACVMSRALVRVQAEGNDQTLHEARIHTKRLRYLLEPLTSRAGSAAEWVEALSALQDQLGELRDRVLLTARLRKEIARAPSTLRDGVERLAEAAAADACRAATTMDARFAPEPRSHCSPRSFDRSAFAASTSSSIRLAAFKTERTLLSVCSPAGSPPQRRETMANITVRKDQVGALQMRQPDWDPLRLARELLRWDPFRDMTAYAPMMESTALFSPAFEVKESKDAYVFKADVPGVKEADLEITHTGNRLTVCGKREADREEQSETYYAYERSYGSFTRSFTLPDGVDTEHIHADLKEGVLTLNVPKKPEAQPRKIGLKGLFQKKS